LLLTEGLKEVDALGLQCVLGASPEGEELYKRFGFEEVAAKDLKLEEYEGGEGMGVARHCEFYLILLLRFFEIWFALTRRWRSC